MASDHLPRIVCDTSVFIDILTANAEQLVIIDGAFLNDAKSGVAQMVVSEITVAETSKLVASSGPVADAVDGFLANTYIRRAPVTPAVSVRAASLVRLFQLDTCDALIVATALVHKATKLVTRDHDINKKIRSKQHLPKEIKGLVATPSERMDTIVLGELVNLEIVCPPSPVVIKAAVVSVTAAKAAKSESASEPRDTTV